MHHSKMESDPNELSALTVVRRSPNRVIVVTMSSTILVGPRS
jgi:hypothetical protein